MSSSRLPRDNAIMASTHTLKAQSPGFYCTISCPIKLFLHPRKEKSKEEKQKELVLLVSSLPSFLKGLI